MTKVLQVGNRTITAKEIIPLLAGYQMLPQLRRELIIDQAIAAILMGVTTTAIVWATVAKIEEAIPATCPCFWFRL